MAEHNILVDYDLPSVPSSHESSSSSTSSTNQSYDSSPPSALSVASDDEDVKLSLELVSAVDSIYECPICLSLLRHPRQTACGHRFCKICLKKWRSGPEGKRACPVCNAVLKSSQIYPDNFAKREINALLAFCPNKTQGCTATCEYGKIQTHLLVCEFVKAACPWCSSVLSRPSLEQHQLKECPRRSVPCKHCFASVALEDMEVHTSAQCPDFIITCSDCGEEFKREKLSTHQVDCPKVIVPCSYADFGCQSKVERGELDSHVYLNRPDHMGYIAMSVRSICKVLKIPMHTLEFIRQGKDPALPSLPVEGLPHATPLGDLSRASMLSLHSKTSGYSSAPPSTFSGPPDLTGYPRPDMASSNCASYASTTSFTHPVGYSLNPHHIHSDPVMYRNLADSQIELDKLKLAAPKYRPAWPEVADERATSLLSAQERQHLKQLPELVRQLKIKNDQLTHRDNVITDLSRNVQDLREKLEEQTLKTIHLEKYISEFEGQVANGRMIFRVHSYFQRKREALRGDMTAIHSPGFYTSYYGYYLCIRYNPNGVDAATGTHVSLFVHFMKGKNDDILQWPFKGRITLSILDQYENDCPQHISETMVAQQHLSAFHRPSSSRNFKGFGFMEFAPIDLIETSRFVKNDTLIIEAKVEEFPR